MNLVQIDENILIDIDSIETLEIESNDRIRVSFKSGKYGKLHCDVKKFLKVISYWNCTNTILDLDQHIERINK